MLTQEKVPLCPRKCTKKVCLGLQPQSEPWSSSAHTFRTEETHSIIPAGLPHRLLLVQAPESFLHTGVDHLTCAASRDPVCCPGFNGCGSGTQFLWVIEPDGIYSLIVPVASRVVNVEPSGPCAIICTTEMGEQVFPVFLKHQYTFGIYQFHILYWNSQNFLFTAMKLVQEIGLIYMAFNDSSDWYG